MAVLSVRCGAMTRTGHGHPSFTDAEWAALENLCAEAVPADAWPALSADDMAAHLGTMAGSDPDVIADVRRILTVAAATGEPRLDALADADRDLICELAAEAFYGSATAPGARMVGYDRGATTQVPDYERTLSTTAFDRVADRYDVVIVGAGAGGGVAAAVCAEAGASVLIVERGRGIGDVDLGADHLRNHRSPLRGINTGPPPGTPRVGADGSIVSDPADRSWHNNAMAVGGGTRVFGAVAWRFVPDDFAMASRYGVPEGSSLADWPIGYEDLDAHYRWVEETLGVAGDATAHPRAGRRSGPYPMAPWDPSERSGEAERLARAAATVGLTVGPAPVMINTVERDGRGACVRCGECAGFACPTNARAGTHNTVLVSALEAPGTDLTTATRVTRILSDASGRVGGVEILDEATLRRRRVEAGHVVVAAGAIESARLLLASRSDAHPDGLGNRTDQVGRHLQGHGFVSAFGLFDEAVTDDRGPGIEIGTLDTAHGLRDERGDVIGGGVVTNELVKQPIVHWRWAMRPGRPRFGAEAKAEMRSGFHHTAHLFGHVQEIPTPGHRVTLADVVDGHGEAVAHLHGRTHPETIRSGAAVLGVAEAWMRAAGPAQVWTESMDDGLLAGHHQAGTCRMGTDPATSVVDPTGRVHGHDNLWVADGSVHVTNGSVNPSLTIMALAHRIAETLAFT